MDPLFVVLKPIFHCDAKPFAFAPHVRLDLQRHNFALGILICLYPKMLKFALPQMRLLKFAIPQMPTPSASKRDIGGVGSPTQGAGVGNVDICFFVFFSFAFGGQRKPSFQWNMDLNIKGDITVQKIRVIK